MITSSSAAPLVARRPQHMPVAGANLPGLDSHFWGQKSVRTVRSSPISTKDCPFGQSFHCRTADDNDR